MQRRFQFFRRLLFSTAAGVMAAVLAAGAAWAQTYGSSSGGKAQDSKESAKSSSSTSQTGTATTTRSGQGSTRDATRESRDTARDTTRDARDTARDTARDARESSREGREEARDERRDSRETSRDFRESARDTAREGREDARDTARDARQSARDTRESARDDYRDTRDEARDRFRDDREFADRETDRDERGSLRSDFRDTVRDTARDALRAGQETARDALDRTRDSDRFGDRDDQWRDFGRDTERRFSDVGRDTDRDTRSVLRDRDDRFDRDDRREERFSRDDREFRDRDSFRDNRDTVSRDTRDRDLRSTDRFSDSRRGDMRISRSQIDNFRASSVDPSDLGLSFARSSRGLIVDSVESNALARTIGLREGDRIVSVADSRVTSPDQFVRFLFDEEWRYERMPLVVVRDGREVPLYVRPVDLIEELIVVRDDFDPVRRFGVVIDDSYDDYVVVRRVLPNTPAFESGLRTGDVITTWQGQRIASPLEFSRVLRRVDTNDVALGIRRDRQTRSLDVSLPREFIRTSSGRQTTFRQDLDADRLNRSGTMIERRSVPQRDLRVDGTFEPGLQRSTTIVPGQVQPLPEPQPAQPVEEQRRPGLLPRIFGR